MYLGHIDPFELGIRNWPRVLAFGSLWLLRILGTTYFCFQLFIRFYALHPGNLGLIILGGFFATCSFIGQFFNIHQTTMYLMDKIEQSPPFYKDWGTIAWIGFLSNLISAASIFLFSLCIRPTGSLSTLAWCFASLMFLLNVISYGIYLEVSKSSPPLLKTLSTDKQDSHQSAINFFSVAALGENLFIIFALAAYLPIPTHWSYVLGIVICLIHWRFDVIHFTDIMQNSSKNPHTDLPAQTPWYYSPKGFVFISIINRLLHFVWSAIRTYVFYHFIKQYLPQNWQCPFMIAAFATLLFGTIGGNILTAYQEKRTLEVMRTGPGGPPLARG